MFYSQFILAKKGPLGTIWIAAHLERKLRKNQVADTDIGVSVDSILFPEVPIALRLSSHLLLGVVRIYSRKVNYLFHDCSEALLKVKQAFRSTAVDLPPEESRAPYHSITLPETFDLDDFELPDSDFLQGNYVDHHISAKEQITLQDTMDGVVYSTSKFGLDERFGDGDTSQIALDLDEELLLTKASTPGHTAMLLDLDEMDPQVSGQLMTPFTNMDLDEEDDRYHEDRPAETSKVVTLVATEGQMEQNTTENSNHVPIQIQNPVENVGSFSCQHVDRSTADPSVNLIEPEDMVAEEIFGSRHTKPDFHNRETQRAQNTEVDTLSMSIMENGTLSEHIETSVFPSPLVPLESTPVGTVDTSSPTSVLTEQSKPASPVSASDCLDITLNALNTVENTVQFQTEVARDKESNVFVDQCVDRSAPDNQSRAEGVLEIVCVSPKGSSKLQSHLGNDHQGDLLESGSLCEKTCAESVLEHPAPSEFENFEAQTGSELENSALARPDDPNEKLCSPRFMLRACSSLSKQCDMASPGDTLGSEKAISCIEALAEGEECDTTNPSAVISESMPIGNDQADLSRSDEHLGSVVPGDANLENEMIPAPEMMLSAPDVVPDILSDLVVLTTTGKEVLLEREGSEERISSLSGKKRLLMESTSVLPDGNLAKLSGLPRSRRTLLSVPDDDDLLSSILVGRKSSALKMKPSTPPREKASLKRPRSQARVSVPKKKMLLMDDTMVLHGDIIRQQLINTEDICRVRRKAPCTRPEVWTIQKHLLEDEIFNDPLFTGLSEELIGLHQRAYDFCEEGASISLTNHTLPKLPTNEPSVVENVAEPHDSVGTVVQLVNQQSENQQPENFPSNIAVDIIPEKIQIMAEISSLKLQKDGQSGDIPSMEIYNENEVADPAIDSHHMDDGVTCIINTKSCVVENNDEVHFLSDDVSVARDQSDILENESDDLRKENFLPHREFSLSEVPDLENDTIETRVDMVNIQHQLEELAANEENTKDVPYGLAVTNVDNTVTESSKDTGEIYSILDVDNDKEGTRSEIEEVVVEELMVDRINNDTGRSSCEKMSNEELHADSSYPLQHNADTENINFNKGENLGSEDANIESNMAMESPFAVEHTILENVAMEDSGVLDDAIYGNDTEFLKFDDEEVDEDGEDNSMQSAEETRLENSGWSSRTRAVAKYLQTVFDKESGHERSGLPMDNLLSGKTRKEASRMFFETLVLKTRDYIHVEQKLPFHTINIKPRAKLMKSEL